MTRNQITVQIRRMSESTSLPLPSYQTENAVGMDVHAAISEPVAIDPLAVSVIPTGFALAVPDGFEAQLRPRSGLASQHGITLVNTPATIDSDYRGEVKVALINLGSKPFTVEPAMRIAQLLILPVLRVQWDEVTELPPTTRGAGGFGHTGN